MNTSPNAKRILIFGDSLTWGYVPGSKHLRMSSNIRYPGVLQNILGQNYEIIEEALNSRGIINGDSRLGKEGRSGIEYIIPCLDTHDPLDIVIVMLGTNEMKYEYNNSPEQIGEQMRKLLKIIINRPSQFRSIKSDIILISPPIVNEETSYCKENNKYLSAAEKSKRLVKIYEELSTQLNVKFLDSSKITDTGIDGIHITEDSHRRIAEKLSEMINE